jgi:hypothetical protein
MPWIRSDSNLPRHPKILCLKTLLGVDLEVVIGRLHFLWWWCLDYALDGDLSKHDPKVIESSCRIPLKTLYKAGFVDSQPYRRIHGWWELQGNYLQLRFKDQPDKWKRIKEMYENDLPMSIHRRDLRSNTPHNDKDVDLIPKRTDVANGRTLIKEKESARVAASPPLALTKVDESDMAEFGHEDFKKAGWINSEKPAEDDSFGWAHFNRAMTEVERVQSKTREKFHAQKKHWN